MIRIARRCIHYFVYDMKMYNKFVLIYFIFTIFPFLFFSVNITRAVSGKIFQLEVPLSIRQISFCAISFRIS